MGELVLWTFLVKTLQSSLGRLLLFNCLRFESGPFAQVLSRPKLLLNIFILLVLLPSFGGSDENLILDISQNSSKGISLYLNQVSLVRIVYASLI